MPKLYNQYIVNGEIFRRSRYKGTRVEGSNPYFEIEDDYVGKAFYINSITNGDINYDTIQRELDSAIDSSVDVNILELGDAKNLTGGILTEISPKTLADFKHGVFGCKKENIIELLKYAFEEVFLRNIQTGKF